MLGTACFSDAILTKALLSVVFFETVKSLSVILSICKLQHLYIRIV